MGAVLLAFHKAKISKVFPGYQADEPFPGIVNKVDSSGSDDKPFKIHYDDGDKEWVTLAELASILVDPALKAKATLLLEKGVPADDGPEDAGATPSGSRKRSQSGSAAAAAPAAAAATKKPRSSAAAAAAAPKQVSEPAAARKGGKAKQQPAAAQAAALQPSGGAKPARKSASAAAAAAAAAAGHDSAAVGPAEFDGLVRDVCQAAPKQSQKLMEDAKIMRSVFKGVGAASLPKMAQAVIMGSEAAFTIYGSARSAGASAGLSPAGHVPADYVKETQDVLRKLQEQIDAMPTMHKRMLTRVRVYLRDVEAGLPAFKEVWDAWIDGNSLPVVTILQGSGPSRATNVVLEANLYMGPPS